MSGVHKKILGAFLLLSLFFSASHMCVDQFAKSFSSSTSIQLIDNAAAASDLASDDSSSHACHLGCCAALIFGSKNVDVAQINSTIKIGYSSSLSRLIQMNLFRPPIA
ncbi:MAG: hypothetical protein J0L93_08385 [Deltaproteobacteria bacterium]|nr:hypothetical protein [Deltaproteobacteria bacterium]